MFSFQCHTIRNKGVRPHLLDMVTCANSTLIVWVSFKASFNLTASHLHLYSPHGYTVQNFYPNHCGIPHKDAYLSVFVHRSRVPVFDHYLGLTQTHKHVIHSKPFALRALFPFFELNNNLFHTRSYDKEFVCI